MDRFRPQRAAAAASALAPHTRDTPRNILGQRTGRDGGEGAPTTASGSGEFQMNGWLRAVGFALLLCASCSVEREYSAPWQQIACAVGTLRVGEADKSGWRQVVALRPSQRSDTMPCAKPYVPFARGFVGRSLVCFRLLDTSSRRLRWLDCCDERAPTEPADRVAVRVQPHVWLGLDFPWSPEVQYRPFWVALGDYVAEPRPLRVTAAEVEDVVANLPTAIESRQLVRKLPGWLDVSGADAAFGSFVVYAREYPEHRIRCATVFQPTSGERLAVECWDLDSLVPLGLFDGVGLPSRS